MEVFYLLKWKGQDLGEMSIDQIRQRLSEGKLNLMSEIHTVQGWLTLDEFLRRLGEVEEVARRKAEATRRTVQKPVARTDYAMTAPVPENVVEEVAPASPVTTKVAETAPPQPPPEVRLPAPTSPQVEIFVSKNGARMGPFSSDQVRGMLEAGVLSAVDPAWHRGLADWQPVRVVLGISSPPPVPPPPRPPATASRPPAATPRTSAASQSLVTPAPSQTGPRGIGGWLRFFCLFLTAISPVSVFGTMYKNWEEASPAFAGAPQLKDAIVFENFGSAALVIYGFVVGCLIWSGDPKGRQMAKTFLIVRLLLLVGIEGVAMLMISSYVTPYVTGVVVGTLIPSVVFSVVWWFYFKVSIRVKNTYGP